MKTSRAVSRVSIKWVNNVSETVSASIIRNVCSKIHSGDQLRQSAARDDDDGAVDSPKLCKFILYWQGWSPERISSDSVAVKFLNLKYLARGQSFPFSLRLTSVCSYFAFFF
jgi:hypothetical protein